MYLLVIFFPLIGSILSGFFKNLLREKGCVFISIRCMLYSTFISYFILFEVAFSNSVCEIISLNWIDCESAFVNWGFYFDSLTAIMLIVVNTVSLCVHMYSSGYMEEDPNLSRFMSYLSLFTFFMLILITSNNFVQMFVGWEGVGLASYLLINFWYTRIQANKSAVKAMIVNRIGDFGLVLGIAIIFYFFKTLDFKVIFSLVPYLSNLYISFLNVDVNIITLICLLLFVGAIGKSAQLGLHVWLPDAMEGPTPVSALIHAATMVTAGVFVLIRCSPLLEYSSFILNFIVIVGSLTAFFASTVGLVQNDIKKVIAYSTCSQLGYMVFCCGLSNYSVSLFHLMNHAFFKALLFLSAGVVIHTMRIDIQDMRRYGGLYALSSISYISILIGSLSLMGFPFLTGFYSKDVILEVAYAKFSVYGTFAHWLGTLSAFFTAFYSFRLVYLTFLSFPAFYPHCAYYLRPHHNIGVLVEKISLDIMSRLMLESLALLCVGSLFIGYFMKDLVIGLGSNFSQSSFLVLIDNLNFIEAEFLPVYIKMLPVIFSILGALFSLFIYSFYMRILVKLQLGNTLFSKFFRSIYIFLNQKWYFDQIYYYFVILPSLNFGYYVTFKTLDRGFIEIFGPLGIVRIFNFISEKMNKLHSGFIFHYVFIMMIGICFILVLVQMNFFIFLKVDDIFYFLFVLFFYVSEKNSYEDFNDYISDN
uniref:NADH-ubiquinone oxidoreductase chain 5 n=1 Tax=Paravannella minima TaxID=1443144 RepID=A0A411K7L2_9EUKA|nr:NADH dehydrogenase subunit 5 [Paravannella minima]QBC73412.1 NADH dehydrogenase subunit 5 [Paravannella minima]